MNNFEDKVFDYLINEKKNFRSAYEIYQVFPEIRDRLINNFWESVEVALEEMVMGTDWIVNADDNYSAKYSKLGLHFHEEQKIRVIYEELHGEPYYGLWINHKNISLNKKSIYKYAENLEILNDMKGPDGKYWLGRKDTQDDFHNYQTLKKLLPENRDDLVYEYYNNLFDFAENMESHIQKILGMLNE